MFLLDERSFFCFNTAAFFLINLLVFGGVMDFSDWDPTLLVERLELEFKNPVLLRTALTHRSFLNQYTGNEDIEHNERLEFLGDAVIEYVVTEHLYRMYREDEGRLTEMRSAIVSGENLARVARSLELRPYIVLARGQPCTDYILACAFEALIGAIDIDRGLPASRLYVDSFLLRTTRDIARIDLRDDKSKLQELLQAARKITPHYIVRTVTGPSHECIFTVALMAGDEQLAVGTGTSKRKAENDAACNALRLHFTNT